MFIPKHFSEDKEFYNPYTDPLNEGLGVTNNTKAVIKYFKDISNDCLHIASGYPPPSGSLFDIDYCDISETKYYQLEDRYTYLFKLQLPKSNNTLEWLDDNTIIIIACNKYNSELKRKKDKKTWLWKYGICI